MLRQAGFLGLAMLICLTSRCQEAMKPYEGKLASMEALKLTMNVTLIFGVANCTILARINANNCLRARLGLPIVYVTGCEGDRLSEPLPRTL